MQILEAMVQQFDNSRGTMQKLEKIRENESNHANTPYAALASGPQQAHVSVTAYLVQLWPFCEHAPRPQASTSTL